MWVLNKCIFTNNFLYHFEKIGHGIVTIGRKCCAAVLHHTAKCRFEISLLQKGAIYLH
jgi:hypothetical protein